MTYCGFFNAVFCPILVLSCGNCFRVFYFILCCKLTRRQDERKKENGETRTFPSMQFPITLRLANSNDTHKSNSTYFDHFNVLSPRWWYRAATEKSEKEKEKHFQFHIHSIADSICVCGCSRNNSILYYFLYPISSSSIRHVWCCCAATIHLKMKNLISKTPEINLQHGKCPRCSGEEIIMKMK